MSKCETCGKRSNFNYISETKGLFCSKHRLAGMVNVVDKMCIKCKVKQASYNFEGQPRLYCGGCKLSNMINVKTKKCVKCKVKIPCFNLPEENIALYCGDCKTPDMIDVKHKKCIKCKVKRPFYNIESNSTPEFCLNCKEDEMIDVVNKKCIVCKIKHPTFNYPNELIRLYCNNCKLPNMINIRKDKMCVVCNYKGETATHCENCKKKDMINVNRNKCIICNEISPSFNYEGETATHCRKCKEPDMIDVVHDMCNDCGKRATYGIPCNNPSACAHHKKEGMISNPRVKCLTKGCNEISIFGITKPTHCFTHKTEDEINLVERKCRICSRLDVLDNDNVCVNFCLTNNIYKKRLKREENNILTLVSEKFRAPNVVDRIIDSECDTKERPDNVWDCGTHYIVLEVDENQHRSYCESGEYSRMINIHSHFNGVPVIFIRYNPNNFLDENGKKSKLNKNKKELELIRWLNYFDTFECKKTCYVLYLFYDYNDQTIYSIKVDKIPKEYKCNDCDRCFYIRKQYNRHMKVHKNSN